MQRPNRVKQNCPVACTMLVAGEWWSVLILRDCLRGTTRFDQLQKSLCISPAMLTRRLQALVDAGLLERRQYRLHPPRYEYLLTASGRDFGAVIAAMAAWGRRHMNETGDGTQHVFVPADNQTS